MVWNPFTIDTDGSGAKTVAPTMFLTYGVKHLKIWTLAKDDVSGGDRGEEGEWRALKALLHRGAGGGETAASGGKGEGEAAASGKGGEGK